MSALGSSFHSSCTHADAQELARRLDSMMRDWSAAIDERDLLRAENQQLREQVQQMAADTEHERRHRHALFGRLRLVKQS